MNNKPSFRQKILLVALGAVFAVGILELAIRLAGVVALKRQERGNAPALVRKDSYRIMCVGESTTQNQYPRPLEEILNRNGGGIKFSVIDAGQSGIDSNYIMENLEANLAKYHPDMVVAMMGSNDYGTFVPSWQKAVLDKGFWARHFRTYKLARLLNLAGENMKRESAVYGAGQPGGPRPDTGKGGVCVFPEPPSTRTDRNQFSRAEAAYRAASAGQWDVTAYIGLGDLYRGADRLADALKEYAKAIKLDPRSAEALLRSGDVYRLQGRPADAEGAFKKVIRLDPRNVRAYFALGDLYLPQGRNTAAEAAYKKAIELNPENSFIYTQLAIVYCHQGRAAEVETLYKQALEHDPFNEVMQLYLVYTYINGGKYAQAEKILKNALEADPPGQHNLSRCMKTTRALAEVYRLMKRDGLAAEYDKEAKELETEWRDKPTAGNYRKMKATLDKRGIALAAVQYPMRSIAPLREIFRGQEDEVLFVDNETLFKDAASRGSYREYFVDMFGGDFGHCTEKGNRLLAGNIADAILKWEARGK